MTQRAHTSGAKVFKIQPKMRAQDRKRLSNRFREGECDFHVMPPPKISGLDELWRIAAAAGTWTYIASLLRDVPKAQERNGDVCAMLHIDIESCLYMLEYALMTGRIPKIRDFRADDAETVIDVAQEILEMDARGELPDHGSNGGDALALLASAREALASTASDDVAVQGRA